MSRALQTLLLLFIFSCAHAQSPAGGWTLERCVDYALTHNINIRQADFTTRVAEFSARQAALARLPNVSFVGSYGRSFGRSVDPTSNTFVDASYNFGTLSGSADVLLFGWFGRRANIAASRQSQVAAEADRDQLSNDVSLNVATGYLRAVLAREQIGVARKQVALSAAQLAQTVRFVEAGRQPELAAAQLESQLATDSSALISAEADYNAALIDLRALLNLPFEELFEVAAPTLGVEAGLELPALTPEAIYAEAKARFGSVRSGEARIRAADQSALAARAARLPAVSLSAQAGTNYSSIFRNIIEVTPGEPAVSPYFIPLADTIIPVFQYGGTPVFRNIPFGNQFTNNVRQTVALNVSVPLFNGWQTSLAARRAEVSAQSERLGLQQTELNLRQNVYRAYNDARNAVAKYTAADRAAKAAARAFDFAARRYDLGLTNTVEYLTTQNNQFRADAAAASAKYDLIFRLKVIDYYLGRELRL